MKGWACVPFHLLKKKRKRQVDGGGKEEEREKWHRPTSIYYAPVTQPLWTRGITMAPWDPHWHPSQSHPLLGQGCRNMQSFCVLFLQSSSFIVCLFSPSCTQLFSHLETDCAAAKGLKCQEPSTASCPDWEKSVKGRKRESWPGHTVDWGREPATRAIAVVADLPAQGIHLWLTICLGSCKHQQNTIFFSSSAILSLLLPLTPSMPGRKQGMQHLRPEVTSASHLPGHPYISVRAVQGSFSS